MSLVGRDLGLRRGSRWILRDVSLTIGSGEVVALAGPNGAGKSTLMGLLAGELAPHAGAVHLDGEPLTRMTPRDQARRRAVLPQRASLTAPFLVEEVIALGRHAHAPCTAVDLHAATDGALALADALALRGRRYTELSGGEQQRVQLARVLAQIWTPVPGQGRYLLLDEPSASLDPGHASDILARVRRFAATGVGVVIALHDLHAAARFADRVVLLAAGEIVADGEPAEVIAPERLQRAFGAPFDVFPHPEGWPMAVPRTRPPP